MPIFVVLIIISLVLYLFYKVKSVRSHLPMEKKWISGKSSIVLGTFVAFFGINQVFLFQSTITYIIAVIFILMGGISIIGGYTMYKFYLPYAMEEAEQFAQQKG
jgi:hypothetical protein